jgi:VanZ family protein
MKYFIPAIIWIIIVTALSAMPGLPKVDWEFISIDKAVHFAVYAIMAWLIYRGFYRNNAQISLKYTFISFVLAASWGMLMEWMQGTFFPYRSFEWPDEVANMVGAAMGAAYFCTPKLRFGGK